MIQLRSIVVNIHGSDGVDRRLFALRKLDISHGQKIFIRGASGQGKTTLLHLMAGLFLPDEGIVSVGDVRLDTLSDEERCHFRRKNIGLVFQKLNLLEHLTAIENVLLALPGGASHRQKAEQALEIVGLKEKINLRSSVLSLGEQQRVAVARVVASAPPIIFADEPTSSLDEGNSQAVIESLLNTAQNKTLVVVSHDQRIQKHFAQPLNFTDLVAS